MSILNHDLVSHRYFYPRPGSFDNVFWVQVDGARLACYYKHQSDDALTMVHFHGNGELVEDYLGDYVEKVMGMGLNLCLVEYRGYGVSTGQPQLVTMLRDVEGVFQALGQPASQLLVYGRSIGSIYAIEFAHRYPDIAGLVIESGIASPLERVLLRVTPEELNTTLANMQDEANRHLNHQKKLESYTRPLLVLHTEVDGIVDVNDARRNHQWAASQKKELHIFSLGNHNTLMYKNWDEYFSLLSKFAQGLQSKP